MEFETFLKLQLDTLSTAWVENWAHFRSMHIHFRDTGGFQNCHIWAWNLELKKDPEVAYGPSDYPILLWAAIERGAELQNCHILAWNAWNPEFEKVPEVAYVLSFYSRVLQLSSADISFRDTDHFRSMDSSFRNTGHFWKLPYWTWDLEFE